MHKNIGSFAPFFVSKNVKKNYIKKYTKFYKKSLTYLKVNSII